MPERAMVLVASPDRGVARRIAEALDDNSGATEIVAVTTLAGAQRLAERDAPTVIVFDQALMKGELPAEVLRELARRAPVIAAVDADAARHLAPLVAAGSADFIPLEEGFRELAAALVERRLNAGRAFLERLDAVNPDESADFGSILRHELNNPLTGILGNAEMLLNRRQRLPEGRCAPSGNHRGPGRPSEGDHSPVERRLGSPPPDPSFGLTRNLIFRGHASAGQSASWQQM